MPLAGSSPACAATPSTRNVYSPTPSRAVFTAPRNRAAGSSTSTPADFFANDSVTSRGRISFSSSETKNTVTGPNRRAMPVAPRWHAASAQSLTSCRAHPAIAFAYTRHLRDNDKPCRNAPTTVPAFDLIRRFALRRSRSAGCHQLGRDEMLSFLLALQTFSQETPQRRRPPTCHRSATRLPSSRIVWTMRSRRSSK